MVGADEIVGPYVFGEIGKRWLPGIGTTLGFVSDDGELIGGVVFSAFDGTNVLLDAAAKPRSRWLDRRGLWAIFHYCFEQLQVTRATALIPSTNVLSRKLVEQIGFVEEARLERAAPGEDDMIVYRLFREECRWLDRRQQRGSYSRGSAGDPRRERVGQ